MSLNLGLRGIKDEWQGWLEEGLEVSGNPPSLVVLDHESKWGFFRAVLDAKTVEASSIDHRWAFT